MTTDRSTLAQERRPLAQAEVAALRRAIDGLVFVPGDSGYDTARIGRGPYPVEDRFPALVVQPQSPADVVAALEFSQANALEVSVRSGGHDVLRASTTASGMVIDLARLAEVRIDPAAGVAVAGAGALAGDLVEAAAPHDFAPVVGASSVGLGGLTLGGGLGATCGTQGATVDNLLAADVVTADGQVLRASAEENPDLFWALRGGGGNFGVVTSFTYRLPKTPSVLAGTIAVRAEAGAALRFIRDYLAEIADELDLLVLFPPGRDPVSVFIVCWDGDEAAGQRALRPLRTFAPVIAEDVATQPFARYFASFSDEAGLSLPKMEASSGSLDSLDDEAIDGIAEIVSRGVPEDCFLNIGHYMHGALCRVPAADTPLIRRPGSMLYNVAALWSGDTEPAEKVRWVTDSAAALWTHSSRQVYINYLSYDDSDLVRDAYGPHYPRLLEIKRRYDPSNIFRGNRNIVPDA